MYYRTQCSMHYCMQCSMHYCMYCSMHYTAGIATRTVCITLHALPHAPHCTQCMHCMQHGSDRSHRYDCSIAVTEATTLHRSAVTAATTLQCSLRRLQPLHCSVVTTAHDRGRAPTVTDRGRRPREVEGLDRVHNPRRRPKTSAPFLVVLKNPAP